MGNTDDFRFRPLVEVNDLASRVKIFLGLFCDRFEKELDPTIPSVGLFGTQSA